MRARSTTLDSDSSLLVTIAEAAASLRISQRSVRRLIESGRVESVRIGKSRRLRRSDLLTVAERGVAANQEARP
jgi:excisionase family DNA binding protein